MSRTIGLTFKKNPKPATDNKDGKDKNNKPKTDNKDGK